MTDPLKDTPWADWRTAPVAGDASARSYARLSGPDGASVIRMTTPAADHASQQAFCRLALWLRDRGLAAPAILLVQGETMVVEDLGTTDLAATLRTDPGLAVDGYDRAVDILIHLHHQPPPDLAPLTPARAGEMVEITATTYADRPDLAAELAATMAESFATLCGAPDRIALRDFHAENLIWRPQAQGLHRLGLLDFQDAFLAPAGYDLISLLRDARRDVDAALRARATDRFCTGAGLDPEVFAAQAACLGVQRNLRILGVFARLARVAGKTRYLAFLPRVWAHVQEDLDHPALAPLRPICAALPPPEAAITAWALT